MKISILLPYKENFSPNYPGAVSLFIKDVSGLSNYKKNIIVYGTTIFKKRFPLKYINLDIKKQTFKSQSENYIEQFIKKEKINSSDLIEIHNRPSYLKYLISNSINSKYILYFHNDPLTMRGSKSIQDRIFLLNNCSRIVFNSQWSKKRFLQNIKNKNVNLEKLIIIYQSSKKEKIDLRKKKRWITFVGKLNKAKGYDIFGNAVLKILNKYKNWRAIVIGDERRENLIFKHKNLKVLGFLNHNKVLSIFKKTSIAVACARWDEPLGRSSLEASSKGCAVIISNRGGLPETVTDGIILKKLNAKELYDKIKLLIEKEQVRINYQRKSYQNFYLTHQKSCKEIDEYRNEILIKKPINIKKIIDNKKLRILHITNFNERHNGRLFFNTGRRINNGFIRLGHSVLEFSDRDVQRNHKSLNDLNGSRGLNDKLLDTCDNFRPDLIVLGHADLIKVDILENIKKKYPKLRIAQWFLDPLNKKGPDYEKNKKRILDKINQIDASFLTTSPDVLDFLPTKKKFYFIPNPADSSFETLENYNKFCSMDVFYAISHGVHRGELKSGKYDERQKFLENLLDETPGVKFDIYGLNKIEPIWADNFMRAISNSKMGLNLSRGEPIKYYSSDRITQIIGNGLVTLIDEKTMYKEFFNNKEMIFYKNSNDLSEKIIKVSHDDKLRRSIGEKGKKKYLKYFNSNLVAEYIINKTYEKKTKHKNVWSKI